MIGKLASKTAERFITRPNICYDKLEIYEYGFFVLYSNIIFLLLTMLLGAALGVFLQSIILYAAFFSIRQYAGGYHASTETRCEILSTLSILVCIVVIKLSKSCDFQIALLAISVVSAIIIFALCPLDTPEKPLSETEFKYFRKISWLILSVISLVVIISYFVRLKWLQMFFAPCCLSLILESLLLTVGKLKKLTLNKS